MLEYIVIFYFVAFAILGLVVYHSIFNIWYFNLGKGLLSELIGAAFFGCVMTGLAMLFWKVAVVVIAVIGLALAGKVTNAFGKTIVIIFFGGMALVTAIVGHKYSGLAIVGDEKENREYKYESEESQDADLDSSSYSDNEQVLDSQQIEEDYNVSEEIGQEEQYEYDFYILPDSSSVRLTDSDIEDFTLQEINYAKNEIYARHGRKFKSKELNDYFNSQSWYNGTIEPEDFDEDMLSPIEKDNIRKLSDTEFSIDPNGYQLDR